MLTEKYKQLPCPQQAETHCFASYSHSPLALLHRIHGLLQGTDDEHSTAESDRERDTSAEDKHMVLLFPVSPTYPDKHSPQVCATREQLLRCRAAQSGAALQFTALRIVVAIETSAFCASTGSDVDDDDEEEEEEDDAFSNADRDDRVSPPGSARTTIDSRAAEDALYTSKTSTRQSSCSFDERGPAGIVLCTREDSDRLENTRLFDPARKENWNEIGRSSSLQ